MESVRGTDPTEHSKRAQLERQETQRSAARADDDRRATQQADERREGRGRELDKYA